MQTASNGGEMETQQTWYVCFCFSVCSMWTWFYPSVSEEESSDDDDSKNNNNVFKIKKISWSQNKETIK